jgi:hypothetical protein
LAGYIIVVRESEFSEAIGASLCATQVQRARQEGPAVGGNHALALITHQFTHGNKHGLTASTGLLAKGHLSSRHDR